MLPALLLLELLAAAPSTCDALYEGTTTHPPDPPAARRCFEAEKDWLALAVISAWGDGGEDFETLLRRFTDSKAPLPEWAQFDRPDDPEQTARVLEAIRALPSKRVSPPRPGRGFERLCHSASQTTLGTELCVAETLRLETEARSRESQAWFAALTPAQLAKAEALTKAFDLFERDESMRAYQRYIDGTIRGTVAQSQAGFVREAHFKHLKLVLEDRAVPPADQKAFAEADRALNKAYAALPSGEKKEAREAQRRWIAYRDAFEALHLSLGGPDAGAPSALGLRTVLTRWRTWELERDPLTGERDTED